MQDKNTPTSPHNTQHIDNKTHAYKKQQTSLKICHQNIDWLANKIERLSHFLSEENPDIVVLTEHGLSRENLENTCIYGYSLAGGFSRKSHIKGGVSAYIKNGQQNSIKLLNTSDERSELVCEAALFEIKLKKDTLLLLGVYRPPSANLDSAIKILTELLDKTLQSNKKILLMGDINVNNLQENKDNTKIEEFLSQFNITRLKLPATRITKTTATSIDWICTNIEAENILTAVTQSGLSDHLGQLAMINFSRNNTRKPCGKRRNFSENAIESLKLNLASQDWERVHQTEDVNSAYNAFHNIIQSNLNLACPFVNSRKKRRPTMKYWDEECSRLKNAYTQALEKQLLYGRIEDKLEATARKKHYDLKLRSLRKQQTAAYINKAANKSKALWQVINGERKAKAATENQLQLQENGRTIKDPVEIANQFNKFFAAIPEKTLQDSHINPSTNHHTTALHQVTNNKFFFQTVTQNEVLKVIDSLKPKSSAGIDEISAKVTKFCREELSTPLTYIINKSMHQGTFPEKLKISKVYPKYKKGPIEQTNSYRPISLIPTFSKVIEKIVLEQLMSYLHQNNLLTNYQHGFLKNRSTATALIQLVEYLIDRLEEGSIATSLFLDFSKAFDCLSHNCLLNKLKTIGITGKSAEWFKSYLSNRKQLVELQSTSAQATQTFSSDLANINRGVPQGSVLGPVLFLLLTNDLPAYLESVCHTVMFADDTVITVAEKERGQLASATQEAFLLTNNYCASNQLVLNKSKTVQIVFTTKGKEANRMQLGLEPKNDTRHLGITIDSTLSWNPHVNQLCKKLSSGIFVIRRLKQVSNLETAKTAYFALLESQLRYGIATWGGTTSSNLEKVLIRQKAAVRCLADLGNQTSCRAAFVKLKILTVTAIYIHETILYTASSAQPRNQDVHNYNTRNTTAFALPSHHLTLFSKKPSYAGAKFFNHLPEDLKNSKPQHLKRRLKTWLLERPFYSTEEFMKWKDFPVYT